METKGGPPNRGKRRKERPQGGHKVNEGIDNSLSKSDTSGNFDESADRVAAPGMTGIKSEAGEKGLSVDLDSSAIPLSLIKGLRRKSSSIGMGSNSSNGGGSGNNSDNSALVSIGNNSFGFNFDSEEMLNSSPQNSGNGESDDSDRKSIEVTVSSSSAPKAGEAAGAGRRSASAAQQQERSKRNQQHAPPMAKPSSSSLNSQQSGGGTGDSRSSSGGESSNGNGNDRSSGKSTVSSITSATMSSNSNENNAATSSHDAAAAAAVANLQSIVNAYSDKTKSDAIADRTKADIAQSSSGKKRKSEDNDDNDGNDSEGYNSDDEGGAAASRGIPQSAATSSKPGAAPLSSSFPTCGESTDAMSMPSPSLSHVPSDVQSMGDVKKEPEFQSRGKRKKIDDNKREERNAREKERSFRISRQIGELRSLLSSGGVIVPKGTKSSVLTEAANYIRMLQQHQYRSEIDRHQLVQQIQQIGTGAIGPQAAGAIRHVAAQNGVWQLGNFGGVPPRSAMTYYQQGAFGAPGANGADANQPQQMTQEPPLVTKIDELEYRFVFNSCAVGMAIASMGGAFIDCNNMFCQLSQYNKQEVCSMTIFNLTSRVDLQHAFDQISQMISPPTDTVDQGGPPSCLLRGSMKHRDDLGLSVTLIKGDDGIAKCFCVTLIKNPISPFDPSRPVPATPDMVIVGGSQLSASIGEAPQKGQAPGNMSSPAYTTG
uniref:BHLH domain-containing protein n=1 Tax=Ditylum brightwellii TaxID=49249 RepID=A0A7S4T1V0_9STRA|mmetsp:Transcript_59752/g.88628  ORF Transcript_59752/g.88628 Transcript_59752/m.88628 type:complete len:711 (-) Transcript_59752:644-2776(-)